MLGCCFQTISMALLASSHRGSCWCLCPCCEGKGTITAACHLLDNQPNRAGREWLIVARSLLCKSDLFIKKCYFYILGKKYVFKIFIKETIKDFVFLLVRMLAVFLKNALLSLHYYV